MANRLHRNESVTKRLRRIVRKNIKLAIEAIESAIAGDDPIDNESDAKADEQRRPEEPGPGDKSGPDKAIHDARQRLKQARAGLRLLRHALGKNRYDRENMTLRDAARPLTELRDARVLVDTFAMLEVGDAARLDPELLTSIDRYLIQRRAALRQPSHPGLGAEGAESAAEHPLSVRLEPALLALKAAHRRAVRWPLDGHGWPAVAAGLERAYRNGRAALALARRNPSVEQLHEWRKQAKYLRYQLEMLEPMRPKLLRTLTDQAHKIGAYLGDNHDLALLAEVAGGHFSAAPDAGRLLAIIDHRRDQLASRAVTVGVSLYRHRPKAFIERLHAPWHVWRNG